MEMGEIIKQLRKAHNLTQEELGKRLGVQKSAIAKYEKGRVENIKRSTIQADDISKAMVQRVLNIEEIIPETQSSAS